MVLGYNLVARPGKGVYYYLYLILDVYSRKIVGWDIHDHESSENAPVLMSKTHLRERVVTKTIGSALRQWQSNEWRFVDGETLYELEVASSYSRPRVSNDNAFA